MGKKPTQKYKELHAKKHKVSMQYKSELLLKQTVTEKMLYESFKKLGRNPKKQRVIWNDKSFYILDFYFTDKKVCIEIDGGIHYNREEYDDKRDSYLLNEKGVVTLRFTTQQVLLDSDFIANSILDFINKLPKYNHNRRKFHDFNEKRIMMYRDFRLNPPQRQ